MFSRQLFDRRQREFALLLLLFASFRLMALLLYRPGGYILEWYGYYLPNVSFVALSDQGAYPFIHYWMEYPPLFPWLAVAVYRLSLLLPPWNDARLWFQLGMGLALLPFEIGNLVLIYRLANLWQDAAGALRSSWFYSLLFAPLFTWLGWFDPMPLFFLLLALYLALTQRIVRAGIAIGLGFMTKLLPALILPIVWRTASSRREALRATIAAVAATLAVAAPFLWIRADLLAASFISPLRRGSWETVWALLDGYFSGGVVTPLADRFDPATAAITLHPSHLPWPLITLAFGLAGLWLYLRPLDWKAPRTVVAFAGLTVSLFMLWSKGYSPQFIIYLLPFVALLLPNLRGGIYAVLLGLANVAEWPVAQLMLPDEKTLFAAVIVFRTLLLIALAVEYGAILFPRNRVHRWLKPLPVLLTLLAVAGSTIAAPSAFAAYRAARLQADPYRQAISSLTAGPTATFLFADRDLYHRFYPYLANGQQARLMTSVQGREAGFPWLARQTGRLWLLDSGSPEAAPLRDWLNQNAFPAGGQWFDTLRADLYGLGDVGPDRMLDAPFSAGIRLDAWAHDEGPLYAGDIFRLRLTWETDRPVTANEQVFVHLLGPDGRLLAQHDSAPAAGRWPTTSWQPHERVADAHGIPLPADLPPGDYELVAGLYDPATGQRLQRPDGTDHVRLGQITIRSRAAK